MRDVGTVATFPRGPPFLMGARSDRILLPLCVWEGIPANVWEEPGLQLEERRGGEGGRERRGGREGGWERRGGREEGQEEGREGGRKDRRKEGLNEPPVC